MSKKPLNFIHISRTGGQSVVTTALENEINWRKITDYHKPFPLLSKEEKDPYDWFTIVRNPYTRIISDYTWCHINIFFDKNMGDKDYFNSFLVKWITNLNSPYKEPMNYLPFIYHDKGKDHFTESYKYIDFAYPIRVLRSEALEEDFNALMSEYGHPFTLGSKVNDLPNKQVSISDMYPETIELIKKVYARDFELFGYSTDPEKANDVPPPIVLPSPITFEQQQ
jgi:hypothetical protein